MDNEEVLTAFGEFLDSHNLVGAILATFGRETLVAAVREFGGAIDPVPLTKATDQKMQAFVDDHSRVQAGRNPLQRQLQKTRAQLRRSTYEAAMLAFKHFRSEVLAK